MKKDVPEIIVCSPEEEEGHKTDEWFDAYFTGIRPLCLKRQAQVQGDKGCFFVGKKGGAVANVMSDLDRLWNQALAPSKDDRVSAGFGDDHSFYFKWRHTQLEQCVLHVSACCGRHRPTEEKVKAIVAKERWEKNVPNFPDVLQVWVSLLKTAIEDDEAIIKSVVEQEWKGINLKDFGEPKGKGIFATMPFSKGDVVCDYHGKLISESEGKKMMEEKQEGMSYLLFIFKGRLDTKLCMDAETFPCECQPGKETFGRRMNHSGKAFNVKPEVFHLSCPDGQKDTL
ncbi:uncharacterized protein LOC125884640 [Epinephelus fuscoguttatus]|uniref:uncharacterized protein LOC125884640 n=1 Tax=Epinephelus fuscoguttatus TaxID=293821 RepID=UPI0020D07810|nr:uncharacterized protein LOC125884640 [Epinephelus fuscoguttatus]